MNDKPQYTIQSNGKIVIIDSAQTGEDLMIYENQDRDGYYPVYYAGKLIDTFVLGNQPLPAYYKKNEGPDMRRILLCTDSTKFRIIVDTSFNLKVDLIT
ncbi:MAG: hypothetical protein HYZ42_10670 [Bacteroidetes bacterium]|nr:hypothetical protein [Bacteroidota bacterium]